MNDPLRPFRRTFRAWRKSRRLEKEGRRYRELFREKGFALPDDAGIRAAISSRFPNLSPRQKGSLNILAIYHSYNWEGPSLGPSLAAFGKVRTIDWMDPALSNGLRPGERGWKERMNEGLLAMASGWAASRPFDAVFAYLSGEQVSPQTIAALRELGAPIVNLALNAPRYPGKSNACRKRS